MGQYLFPDLSFPNGLTVMLQRIMRTVLNYQSEEGGREGRGGRGGRGGERRERREGEERREGRDGEREC